MNAKLTGLVAAAAVLLTVGTAAAAETQGPADISKEGEGMLYNFRDADALTGGNNGANGGMITVKNAVMRRTLIRPRASFVTEMLKSVENI